jgi:hypothetical protein
MAMYFVIYNKIQQKFIKLLFFVDLNYDSLLTDFTHTGAQ